MWILLDRFSKTKIKMMRIVLGLKLSSLTFEVRLKSPFVFFERVQEKELVTLTYFRLKTKILSKNLNGIRTKPSRLRDYVLLSKMISERQGWNDDLVLVQTCLKTSFKFVDLFTHLACLAKIWHTWGRHSTMVSLLACGPSCPGFDSQHSPQKNSEAKIVDVA